MLYTKEKLFDLTVCAYKYLQMRVKKDPHCFKYEKQYKCVEKFCDNLPDDAGVDYIWNFMVYQFYLYQTQNHERRPTIQWFLGKEAYNRWNNASEESKWYSSEWAHSLGFKNPLYEIKYISVSEDAFYKERYRMSRISGPNYCAMKFSNPYTPGEGCCVDCPFLKDCNILFSEEKAIYNEVMSSTIQKSNMIKIRDDVWGL